MKVIIALAFATMLLGSSMATEVSSEATLTQEDYDSLVYWNMFHYGITRREAIKNMGSCVYNAGKLGWEIYQLCQAFQIQKVPSIVKRIITCVNKCQSFKYLQLTKQCGDKVKSAAGNLKKNFNLYKILKNKSRIQIGLKQLRSDLSVIEKVCVVV